MRLAVTFGVEKETGDYVLLKGPGRPSHHRNFVKEKISADGEFDGKKYKKVLTLGGTVKTRKYRDPAPEPEIQTEPDPEPEVETELAPEVELDYEVTPQAQALADDIGIDLADVTPSDGQTIRKSDVEKVLPESKSETEETGTENQNDGVEQSGSSPGS